jgi:hypothetical protein
VLLTPGLGDVPMPKFLLKMSVIDEKQEAIACIRMAVDNDNLARLNSDDSEDGNVKLLCDVDPNMSVDSESESQHWQLGSPEGKKVNLRVMSSELGSEREEYRDLDERVRDFIACHMPEEAMRYEEDIHVSLFSGFTSFHSVYFSGSAIQMCHPQIPVKG